MRPSVQIEQSLAQLYIDQATVSDPVFPNALSVGRIFAALEAY